MIHCFSEELFYDMADRMAEDGYLEAGYEYLIIDDCWLAKERDENGKLQPDPERFPNGIKVVADYVRINFYTISSVKYLQNCQKKNSLLNSTNRSLQIIFEAFRLLLDFRFIRKV